MRCEICIVASPSVKVHRHQLSTLARVRHQPVTRSGFPSGESFEVLEIAGNSQLVPDDSSTLSGFLSRSQINPSVDFKTGLRIEPGPVHASHFLLGPRP
jgi:hypothetical protein